MKAEKIILGELTLCYCVAPLQYQGKRHFLVASEKQHPCLLFDEAGNYVDKVWDGPGGTMTIVQVPGVDGAFLATHRFYSPNDNKQASIILCRHADGAWKVRTLLELPGVHRFDVLERNGVHYLIACTIKSDYEYKDDWRFPGKVYAAVLPENLTELPEDYRLEAAVICPALTRNHGYSRDGQTGIVTADEGVFRFTPPEAPGGDWGVEQLLAEPTSDALLLDLDGDGEKELLTLSPFHGDTLRVCKPAAAHTADPQYERVFEYEAKIPFAHAICSAAWNGKQIAVIGHRKEARDLLAVYHDGMDYRVALLDHDVGPANALSYQLAGKTRILSANRETNEIALYTLV